MCAQSRTVEIELEHRLSEIKSKPSVEEFESRIWELFRRMVQVDSVQIVKGYKELGVRE
jgi:hypothetical protein